MESITIFDKDVKTQVAGALALPILLASVFRFSVSMLS